MTPFQRFISRISLFAVVSVVSAGMVAAAPGYRWDFNFGSAGDGDGQFVGPHGIAVVGDRLYVADVNNARISLFSLTGAYLGRWDIDNPWGIAAGRSGGFYVTRVVYDVVSIFSSSGLIMGSFGTHGDGYGQFNYPLGINVDRTTGHLWVTDRFNHRVQRLTSGGTAEVVIGGPTADSSPGRFNEPGGVVTDGAGSVWVADTGNSRIQQFTTAGVFVRQFGSDRLLYPYSLTRNASGHLLVCDTLNDCLREYQADGVYLRTIGTPGTGDRQLNGPSAAAVSAGRLYICDADNKRISVWKPNTAPTAPASASVAPVAPKDGNDLVAKYGPATDADGDTLTYRFAWYRSADGGAHWNAGPTRRVVPASLTSVGEVWKFKVRAFDGDATGPWRMSAPVTILAPGGVLVASASAIATANGGAQLSVHLSTAASAGAIIRNLAGWPVATLAPRRLPAGTSTLLWDGRSNTGTRAPAGQYLVTVEACGDDGSLTRVLVPLHR